MKFLNILRLNQWIKNGVIFTAFFTAGNLNLINFVTLIKVFISFSLIVSSTYILNDLLDIKSDQNHPIKKNRPIASGLIDLNTAKFLMIVVFTIGKIIIFITSKNLIIYTTLYVFLTIFYSLKLKFVKYFDLLSISILFVFRILLGAEAIEVPTSTSLILFIFFSCAVIAIGKKNSILIDPEITNSKVKNFLKDNYTIKELNSLLNISSKFSLITFFYWAAVVKSNLTLNLTLIFYVGAIYFLYNFFQKFSRKTDIAQTEEIIKAVMEDNKLIFDIVMFLFFSIMGILF
jgi:4-hydroxybenzoate polyprenyltransferase